MIKKVIFIVVVILLSSCSDEAKIEPEERLTGNEAFKYQQVGLQVSKLSFEILKEQLTKAFAEGGVIDAVGKCSVVAMPITDSLSKKLNVKIKRASHKARNPKNKADAHEMKIINEYQKLMDDGKELQAIIGKTKNRVRYYAPIGTLQLCINCHGDVKTQIGEENYSFIKKLYPQDEANGFKLGELRGIWSIEF